MKFNNLKLSSTILTLFFIFFILAACAQPSAAVATEFAKETPAITAPTTEPTRTPEPSPTPEPKFK